MKGCVPVIALCLVAAAPAQPPSAKVITVTSSRAMIAVAQGLTEATWNPILDKRVQQSPAAAVLGAAWTPSDARWKKARAALAARVTRLFDSYARSGEIDGFVEAEVGRMGVTSDLDRAIAALQGAASPSVVRLQARQAYIVQHETGNPANRPAIGSPEWNKQLADFGKEFDDRVAPKLAPDDGSHVADAEKLAATPAWSALARVWTFAISNGTRQLNTALNLMMFDDKEAIERDIAAAIGQDTGATVAKPSASPINLERMAACQDSWLDWKDDPARANAYVDGFNTGFRQSDSGSFTPIAKMTAAGLTVTRVYPGSVGMAVGFSIVVDAPFDRTKKAFEQVLGKPLTKCETSEGTRTCELEIAEKKTYVMIADATGKTTTTLAGCFYFYEK